MLRSGCIAAVKSLALLLLVMCQCSCTTVVDHRDLYSANPSPNTWERQRQLSGATTATTITTTTTTTTEQEAPTVPPAFR